LLKRRGGLNWADGAKHAIVLLDRLLRDICTSIILDTLRGFNVVKLLFEALIHLLHLLGLLVDLSLNFGLFSANLSENLLRGLAVILEFAQLLVDLLVLRKLLLSLRNFFLNTFVSLLDALQLQLLALFDFVLPVGITSVQVLDKLPLLLLKLLSHVSDLVGARFILVQGTLNILQ